MTSLGGRAGGLACVVLWAALPACSTVPVHPSTLSPPSFDEPIDAKITVAPKALSTSGALPRVGSTEHDELRRHVVNRLNALVGSRANATVKLPTQVRLEHRTKPNSSREQLWVRLTTELPSGLPVETVRAVPWSPPAGLFPATTPAGQPGCGAPWWCGLGGCPGAPCGSLGGGVTGLLIGAGVAVLVGVVAVAIVVAVQSSTIANARTTAFSDTLERALAEHARAVHERLLPAPPPTEPLLPRLDDPGPEPDVDVPDPADDPRPHQADEPQAPADASTSPKAPPLRPPHLGVTSKATGCARQARRRPRPAHPCRCACRRPRDPRRRRACATAR